MRIKTKVPGMVEKTKMIIENDDFNIPVVIDNEVKRMQVEVERTAIPGPIKEKDVRFKIYNNEKEIPCDWNDVIAIATSPTAQVIQHEGYVEFIVVDKFGTSRAILYGGGDGYIQYKTKSEWDSEIKTISQQGIIYVYTDYTTDILNNQPGIKIGDGETLLIDLPFMNDISNLPKYTAGNGLVLNDYKFSLDDLILECGTSTTVIQE